MTDLWLFAGIVVLGQFSPGPDMLLLTRTAVRDGGWAGVRMAAGITCGLAFHAAVAVFGAGALLAALPGMRRGFGFVAGAYLLWLAYRILAAWHAEARAGDSAEEKTAGTARADGNPFARGFLCNILNPKAALFLCALCERFSLGERPGWWPYALWATITGFGIGLWSLWSLILQWEPVRNGYRSKAAWIEILFAAALAVLGLRLIAGA